MPAQPGAGRPTKYTEQTVAKLLDALRGGNTRRAACAVANISQDTLAVWLKDKPEFSDAVEKAEGEAEEFDRVQLVHEHVDDETEEDPQEHHDPHERRRARPVSLAVALLHVASLPIARGAVTRHR